MQGKPNLTDSSRMAANLRRAIELTELGLELRLAVLRQQNQDCADMKDVMHEIRLAKEEEWQRWVAQEAGSTLNPEQ